MKQPAPIVVDEAQARVGRLLARARVLQEMTQADLARAIGVSERVIQRMEAGANTTVSTWLCAAQRLGYLDDILSVMKQDKPNSLEHAQAIAENSFRRRQRVRR